MFSFSSSAANYYYSGKIIELKTHAEEYVNSTNPWGNMAWITIENISINDVCKPQGWSNGLTPFYLSSKSPLFSVALAAHMSNKPIKVHINDSVQLVNGVCKVEFIGL